MDANDEPDWVIDLGSPPIRPSVEQAALLAELERELARFGARPAEHRAVIEAVAPLVNDLHDSGMTVDRIAAHCRIRPEGITRILNGDAGDNSVDAGGAVRVHPLGMEAEQRQMKWPWIAVLIVAPIIVFFTFGMQVGRCVDYTAESGMTSFCEVGPQVSWPGAIVIAIVCVALFALAIVRLALRSRRRAGGH